MKAWPSNVLLLAVLAILAGIAGFMVPRHDPVGSVADAPLGMPANGPVDHRFDETDLWQTAQIPLALRFDLPMGTEHGGLVQHARKFREMDDQRGGQHTGDDLNGIGGMNTDLGDPVFSAADGLVLYAAEPSPGWGKTILIAHRLPDGRVLHSVYAHLHRIDTTPGSLVARGGKIGTVGTANGSYPAHLHFEMREGSGIDFGDEGYVAVPPNRLDPLATIRGLRNATPDDLSPSPFSALLAGPGDR